MISLLRFTAAICVFLRQRGMAHMIVSPAPRCHKHTNDVITQAREHARVSWDSFAPH
jgi:hypothetical protein